MIGLCLIFIVIVLSSEINTKKENIIENDVVEISNIDKQKEELEKEKIKQLKKDIMNQMDNENKNEIEEDSLIESLSKGLRIFSLAVRETTIVMFQTFITLLKSFIYFAMMIIRFIKLILTPLLYFLLELIL